MTAQIRAVIATAQLAAALPDAPIAVRVLDYHADGEQRWMATVEWTDGPDEARVRRILDGPPPGVRLVRRLTVPEPERRPHD